MANDSSLLLFLIGSVLMFQVSFLRGHCENRDRMRALEKQMHELDDLTSENNKKKIDGICGEIQDLREDLQGEIQEIKTTLSTTTYQVNSMDIMKYDYPTKKHYSCVISAADIEKIREGKNNVGTREQPNLELRKTPKKEEKPAAAANPTVIVGETKDLSNIVIKNNVAVSNKPAAAAAAETK